MSPDELAPLAKEDPLLHAFALYDLEHYPQQVRFVTLLRGRQVVSYLLIWYGEPSRPVVHWTGATGWEVLQRGLPAPPFSAIVPPEIAERVAWPGVAVRHPIELWSRRPGDGGPEVRLPRPPDWTVRRLRPADRGALDRFAELHKDEPYLWALGGADPARARIYGALAPGTGGDRLVAVARTTVETPQVWFVGGVYTEPSFRGRGLGREVTGAVAKAAHDVGADCALFVRSDNRSALAAYAAIGFHRAGMRTWVDAGAGPPP